MFSKARNSMPLRLTCLSRAASSFQACCFHRKNLLCHDVSYLERSGLSIQPYNWASGLLLLHCVLPPDVPGLLEGHLVPATRVYVMPYHHMGHTVAPCSTLHHSLVHYYLLPQPCGLMRDKEQEQGKQVQGRPAWSACAPINCQWQCKYVADIN